jgi:hypothetical protein
MLLKHDTEVVDGPFDRDTRELNRAFRRRDQASDHVEHSAFAASTRTDDETNSTIDAVVIV